MDPITLQALLDELARDGGNVATLLQSPDHSVDVEALENEALQAFDGIRTGDSLSDEDVAALESLAQVVEELRTEQSRRAEVTAEQQARVDALAERVRPEANEITETPDPEGDETPTDEDTTDAPAGQADGEVEDAPVTEAEGETEVQSEEQPAEAVAASGRRRVDLARIARRAPRPQAPAQSGPAFGDMLVAAADVPGVSNGAAFQDWTEIAQAAVRRFQGMGSPANARLQQGLAVVRKNFPQELTADGNDDLAVMDRAASEYRLDGGSLVAAGGWCSPSETLYDLLELEAADQLYSLPEINASRGGIRFTKGPRFGDIYTAAAYWVQTEAQVEAATPKPVFEVPCPDWEEIRMDVEGLALKAGILTSRTYPEIIARFIRGALVAHAHRMSKLKIDRAVAYATDYGTLTNGGPSANSGVLGAIELQARAYRDRERMSQNATLELVGPTWLPSLLRADYANRNGIQDPFSVTDAQIIGWMRQRGVNPQFIVDWQPLDGWDKTGTPPDDTYIEVTDWPATAQFLLYAAGTFINLTQDVITLDAIYDSTNIVTNRYNALFTEDGIAVAMRGHEARLFTVATVPNGATGQQVAIT